MKSKRRQIPSSGGRFGPNRWTKLNVSSDNYYTTGTHNTVSWDTRSVNRYNTPFGDVISTDGSFTVSNDNSSPIYFDSQNFLGQYVVHLADPSWNPEYSSVEGIDLNPMTTKKSIDSELARFLCTDLFGVDLICESHVLIFCSWYNVWVGEEAARLLGLRFGGHSGLANTCRERLLNTSRKPSQEDIDFGIMVCKPTPEWKALIMSTWEERGFVIRDRPEVNRVTIKHFKEILTVTRDVHEVKKFECCICFEERPVGHFVKLKPCDHRLTCMKCVYHLDSCPICRGHIVDHLNLSITELLTITEL